MRHWWVFCLHRWGIFAEWRKMGLFYRCRFCGHLP